MKINGCFEKLEPNNVVLSKHQKLNVDYATVFSLAPFISENIITIIGICLLIGAMAKSSQVGLHV